MELTIKNSLVFFYVLKSVVVKGGREVRMSEHDGRKEGSFTNGSEVGNGPPSSLRVAFDLQSH